MKCINLHLPCVARKGEDCSMDICVLGEVKESKLKPKQAICPFSSRSCKADCALYDKDNSKCGFWRMLNDK
jgi:hypothetical protein